MADKWAQLAAQSAPAEGASAPSPADDAWATQPAAPQGTLQRVFGKNPISDTVSNVGTHLANMVSGPYHAFTDAPRSQEEQATVDSHGGMKNPVMNVLNHVGLGAERMLVDPTRDAAKMAVKQAKAGNFNGNEYDSEGNYTPNAIGSAADAIPMAGPWARSIENDANQKGAVPALAGMATDIVGPKVLGKALGAGMRGAGLGAKAVSATPESLRVAGARGLVMGSPSELLTRSLKPSVAYPDFEESLDSSLPAIAKQNPDPGVRGFANAAKGAQGAEQDWFNNIKQPMAKSPIDTTSIVQRGVDSIPATDRFMRPEMEASTARTLSPFDMTPQSRTVTSPIVDEFGKPITRVETSTPQPPTLDDVDAMRKDTNLKGRAAIFQKAGGDRAAALSNPFVARLNAVNGGLRDLEYAHLSDGSGIPEEDIRNQQNLYGHLSDVADVAGKRSIVAGRQNPISLQESLSLNHGNPLSSAYNFATQRLVKGLTNSDAVTDAAMDRYKNPDSVTLNPRSGILPRAMTSAGNAAGSAGRAIARMPLRNNPFFYSASAFRPSKEKE